MLPRDLGARRGSVEYVLQARSIVRSRAIALTASLVVFLMGCTSSASHKEAAIPGGYVGHWYSHLYVLTVDANGVGSQRIDSAAGAEDDSLRFSAAGVGKDLRAEVVAITLFEGGRVTAQIPGWNPHKVGDSWLLRWVDPHVLNDTDGGDAFYVCGPVGSPTGHAPIDSVPQADLQRCGMS
jgi:hypothetical protein